MVNWLKDNSIFGVLFDLKKTHLQLVQRCDEVLKLLLQQDALDLELLNRFWSLTKSDLKPEVFKIISECSFYFKSSHVQFIFEQIQGTPRDQLELEELNCLSELGKYSRDQDQKFQDKVAAYFWDILMSEQPVSQELLENCTTKYKEIFINWPAATKLLVYQELVKAVQSPNSKSVPTLRLFKILLKEHHNQVDLGYSNITSYPAKAQDP